MLGYAACLGAGGTGSWHAEVWRCCARRDVYDPSRDGFLLERSGCSAWAHLSSFRNKALSLGCIVLSSFRNEAPSLGVCVCL